MPIVLRKRPPYRCLTIIPATGQKCLAVLTEEDGKLCPSCVTATKEAHDKFFNAPVQARDRSDIGNYDRSRWPIWPI